ncbi:MAG: hypothetical protein IT196_17550, partial [Acidimicrobiales bacterium]|nr:hypothetical protein [Acidimicrobiales bacterium]
MNAMLSPPRARTSATPPAFDLDAAPTVAGRRRVPELATGVLVIVVFALGALWWQTSSSRQTEVLAVRETVQRGHVMTLADLQVVGVNSDDRLTVVPQTDAATIVGRVARTDLAAGTLVARELFSAGSLIEPGDGVVGLSLGAGEFPSLRLAPGDVVAVVNTAAGEAVTPADEAGVVLVARATGVEVEAVG